MKPLLFFILIAIHFLGLGSDKVSKDEVFLNEQKYDSAIFYYSKQIELIENTDKDSTLATIVLKRSRAYEYANNYEEALKGYLHALNLFKIKHDHNSQVVVYTSLAELARKTQNFDKANYYLNEGAKLLIFNRVTSTTRAKYYSRKAAIISETGGDLNQVIFYSKKVIELAKQTKNKGLEASSLNEIGFVYEKTGNPLCVQYYEEAFNLFSGVNDLQNALNVLINLSRYNVANQNYNEGLKYSNRGLSLFDPTTMPNISIKFYYFQYQSLHHLGRFEEANVALQNYSDDHVITVEMEWNRSLKEIETKYELEVKNNEFENEKNKSFQLAEEAKNKSKQRNYIIVVVLVLIVLVLIIFKLNRSLKSSLIQKEILLQEVHHRVKNNLTLLNSLLFLRGEASKDQNVVDVLNECQARVQTMSIVHQNLYDVDDASKVDFKKFIEELIVESTSIMDCFDKKIGTEINTNNIFLEMGSAVFLGLILNELITNSLKYAFNDDKTHNISIGLSEVKSKYTLTYSDSGPGLPDSFDLKNTSGFGFQLINIMVSQIDGKLEYLHVSNTFSISFKL